MDVQGDRKSFLQLSVGLVAAGDFQCGLVSAGNSGAAPINLPGLTSAGGTSVGKVAEGQVRWGKNE